MRILDFNQLIIIFVAQGNMEAAKASLEQANKWSKYAWIAIAICMVLVVLYCIFVFGASILSAMAEY